jgi:outer membrane protein OmpA-like peptidoglycan-associated protein
VAYNNYSENTTSLVIAKIDSKEEDLEKLLAEREERNKKAVEKITLGAMTFATGKASLTVEAKESVKRQIKKLNSINYSKIIVEGHTDITGNAKFNDKLSQLRAESVCKELISSGISADKLEYTGYGSKIPAADNETPSGRQANRRTEVWVFEEK